MTLPGIDITLNQAVLYVTDQILPELLAMIYYLFPKTVSPSFSREYAA